LALFFDVEWMIFLHILYKVNTSSFQECGTY